MASLWCLCPSQNLNWKVRYRTFLWFFSQVSKLYRAPSLLYRRQILQENIRWKALDEIYKIYTAPNCNLLANILQHIGDLQILQNCPGVVSYRWNLHGILPQLRDIQDDCRILVYYSTSTIIRPEILRKCFKTFRNLRNWAQKSRNHLPIEFHFQGHL